MHDRQCYDRQKRGWRRVLGKQLANFTLRLVVRIGRAPSNELRKVQVPRQRKRRSMYQIGSLLCVANVTDGGACRSRTNERAASRPGSRLPAPVPATRSLAPHGDLSRRTCPPTFSMGLSIARARGGRTLDMGNTSGIAARSGGGGPDERSGGWRRAG